ncbi:MAG: hypothetical protein U0892_04295 [Pirellulales bacterium]
MTLECCDRRDRRDRHADPFVSNGIDFVEVNYSAHKLEVHFFVPVGAPETLKFVLTDLVTTEKHELTIDLPCPAADVVALQFGSPDVQLEEGRRYTIGVTLGDGSVDPAVLDPRFIDCEFTYNSTVGAEVDFISPETPKQSVFPVRPSSIISRKIMRASVNWCSIAWRSPCPTGKRHMPLISA